MWRTWLSVAATAIAVVASTGPASADPADPDIQPVAAAEATPPPVDDGKVVSSPPETAKTLDGWTMTVGGKDETQLVIAPLTTAVSSREYEVGGTFTGSLKDPSGAPAPAKGVLEVGYQIGCGIDMTTGTGVLLGGTAGGSAGLTTFGALSIFGPANGIVFPNAGVTIGGSVAVSLKPGVINIVPITKKAYASSEPWVWVSHQRIKIDGCVGQSFIRSFALLSKATDEGDEIAAWFGATKMV
ncbi:MAG: MspA family porin [Mycobacteriaceae bacterium]